MLLPFLLAGIFTTGAVLSGEGRHQRRAQIAGGTD